MCCRTFLEIVESGWDMNDRLWIIIGGIGPVSRRQLCIELVGDILLLSEQCYAFHHDISYTFHTLRTSNLYIGRLYIECFAVRLRSRRLHILFLCIFVYLCALRTIRSGGIDRRRLDLLRVRARWRSEIIVRARGSASQLSVLPRRIDRMIPSAASYRLLWV